MSLRPDDKRSSRTRSRSASRGDRDDRDRSRSRSNVRAPESTCAPKAPSPPTEPRAPYSSSSNKYGNGVTSPDYDVRAPTGAGPERQGYSGQAPERQGSYSNAAPYPHDDGGYVVDYKDLPPDQRPGYAAAQFPQFPSDPLMDEGLAYGDNSPSNSRQASFAGAYPPEAPEVPYPPQAPGQPGAPYYQYHTPQQYQSESRSSSYNYQYAQPPNEITYTSKPQRASTVPYTQNSSGQHYEQLPRSYSYDHDPRTQEVKPGYANDKSDRKSGSKGVRLSLNTNESGGPIAPRSPGLSARTNRLSVGGGHESGRLPPPSPLLEPYRGTYQQMSPMPMILRPTGDEDELESLEPLSPQVSRSTSKNDKLSRDAAKTKEKKKVKVYDEEAEATLLSQALSKHKVDTGVICEVLPGLSHDQVVYLRKEYKKQVKVQGKGVNLSKHLKTKLGSSNFGTAAYVTALGRWESEGHWANFFYQSHRSRHELLIESLMGRTNIEIWNIKDEFKDKRYADSLVKCMEQELKMDKFRTAVLMVLEERRQADNDVYPIEYRNRDVEMLHKALTAKQGGESTMLEIIVRRSDAHLREVMKTYERMYQENFARAALKKSNNLVVSLIHLTT